MRHFAYSFQKVYNIYKGPMNEPTWTNTKYSFPKGSGTPKSLQQAIRNGLEEIKLHPSLDPETIVWIHLKEFIAQKFFFTHPDVKTTWNKIFPEDKR